MPVSGSRDILFIYPLEVPFDVDPSVVLAELTQVAESVGVEVHSRVLRGSHRSLGGLCHLAGRNMVLLSSKATRLERCTVLAEALAVLGHADHPGLGPDSRSLIARRGRPAAARSDASSGPGLAGGGGHGRRRI
jgi:hypothetical protein